MKNGWKIFALIILVIFILENSLIVWGIVSNNKIEKDTNVCYYDICKDYPDAFYDSSSKLCDCYDNDLLGNQIIAKTEYMGKR